MNRHIDVDGRTYRAVGSSFAAYHPGWDGSDGPDGSLTYTRHVDGTSVTLTPTPDGTVDATVVNPHEGTAVVEGFRMTDPREAAWWIVPSVIQSRGSLREAVELLETSRDWPYLRGP